MKPVIPPKGVNTGAREGLRATPRGAPGDAPRVSSRESPRAAQRSAPGTAKPAWMKLRHFGLLGSFVATVILPTFVAMFYLYAFARDQYTSTVGFAVRSEEISTALGLLGGLSSLSGTSSSDTDILYEYIRSQELVQLVDAQLDLRRIYSGQGFDPIFALDPDSSIEGLTDYWQSMVKVFYDNGTGLIELRVHAFDPDDAKAVADAIFADSANMINELSAAARQDATRYASEELARATDRLAAARIALTQFRSRTQVVDPTADIQSQMGLLTTLQQQQAAAMIELSLLRDTTREGDPRIAQGERRIAVIEEMIADERQKFGVGTSAGSDGTNLSTLVGDYERLTVEREFAENAYVVALTSYDNSLAEAQRKSRYLAAYTGPTRAETALYPQRLQLVGLTFAMLLLLWSIALLVFYSVRDRR